MCGPEEKKNVYKCTLSSQTQAVAKSELREDEKIREQCLEQFREWIGKHQSIKRCRTDSVFLLRFLRTKKFSLPQAQDLLEKYLTIRQLYPDWFQNLDADDPDIQAIIDAGFIVPLLKRDSHGRKVILSCTGRFDPYKYTAAHMMRVHSLVAEALMDDEESQVHGYTHLNDEMGMGMGHVSIWSFNDLRKMLNCMQSSTPMRLKGFHVTNIPGIAMKLIDFSLPLLSEKLRSRVWLHKNLEDLQQSIDPKILPKELGGEVPMADMIAEFKALLKEKRDTIKALDDMSIEISPKDSCNASEGLGGLSGSFRKLEVD